MVGSPEDTSTLGIVPSAIAWLYRLISEQRQRTGARFSVRTSALQICAKEESSRDLLQEFANGTESNWASPGLLLRDDTNPSVPSSLFHNLTELRSPSAEKAAYYLDAALSARQQGQEAEPSHLLFTLHVYQYSIDRSGKGGVAGGRSRLHLLDLGSCDKQMSVFSQTRGYRLALASLGNVILAIFNGQKHIPYKDSKLTQLLKELLGNLTCRATMIAHISSSPDHYTDTLATVQLASRIHRLRHKKLKYQLGALSSEGDGVSRRFGGSSSGSGGSGGKRSGGSDVDCTSSSELSCDTVIFVGSSSTDGSRRLTTIEERHQPPEHPPPVPSFAFVRRTTDGASLMARGPPTPKKTPERAVNVPRLPETNGIGGAALGAVPRQVKLGVQSPVGAGTSFGVYNVPHQEAVRKSNTAAARTTPMERYGLCAAAVHSRVATWVTQSDEFWVDGPRVSRAKIEASLHRLSLGDHHREFGEGLETWIDGPQAEVRFLDEPKRKRIQQWIEMLQQCQEMGEVAKAQEERISRGIAATNRSTPPKTVADTRQCTELITNTVQNIPSEVVKQSDPVVVVPEGPEEERLESSRALTTVVEEIQRESVNWDGQNCSVLSCSCSEGCDRDGDISCDCSESVGPCSDVGCMANRLGDGQWSDQSERGSEDDDDDALLVCEEYETMEAEEEEEGVPTQDACVQATEQDILLSLLGNRLCMSDFCVDHRRCQCGLDVDDHPLRILSQESLPTSFTDSSSIHTSRNPSPTPPLTEHLLREPLYAAIPLSMYLPEHYEKQLSELWEERSACSDPGPAYCPFPCHTIALNRLSRSNENVGATSRINDDIVLKPLPLKLPERLRVKKAESASPQRYDSPSDICDTELRCRINELRCPDGASNPQIHRHPSEDSMDIQYRYPAKPPVPYKPPLLSSSKARSHQPPVADCLPYDDDIELDDDTILRHEESGSDESSPAAVISERLCSRAKLSGTSSSGYESMPRDSETASGSAVSSQDEEDASETSTEDNTLRERMGPDVDILLQMGRAPWFRCRAVTL